MQLQPTRFGALGIPFDIDNVCGVETFDTLGLTFEMGETVRVRGKAERTWRLWGATRALLRRRRISGDLLRV